MNTEPFTPSTASPGTSRRASSRFLGSGRAGAGPRRVIAGLTLVSAVALASACLPAEAGGGNGGEALPPEILGAWCGGANDTSGGHYTWIFEENGSFAASNEDVAFSGVASLTGPDTMVISADGGTATTVTVSLDPGTGLLFLDGYSYVRGHC